MNGRRIAVVIEGRVDYERNVLLGIRDFAAKHADWIIRLQRPGRHVKRFLTEWKPDGILFQASGLPAAALRAIADSGRPAIHVSDSRRAVTAPCVGLDNRLIGQLAAEYFLERGFLHFAFAGIKDGGFSRTRREAFTASLEQAGRRVSKIELPAAMPAMDVPTERRLRTWLDDLPKPVALFAVHDECSLLLATLSREEGIRVPEDIAILGSDDDSLICELAWPKLSSISAPSRQVGRVAAQELEAWLSSGKPKSNRTSVLLPPQGVVTRQSTDVNQTEDETVNRVLRFVAAQFHRQLNVDDILREVGVSRRALERKFRQHLGRSPLQEIHRRRVEHARYLLSSSAAPLHRIAELSGFTDATQFINVFRKQTGITPGQFRLAREEAVGGRFT